MKIGAAKRVAIFLPVETKYVGTARFQIIASSEDFSDAVEISLPVWTPVTFEAFASKQLRRFPRSRTLTNCNK
jgi:hypothetical protein